MAPRKSACQDPPLPSPFWDCLIHICNSPFAFPVELPEELPGALRALGLNSIPLHFVKHPERIPGTLCALGFISISFVFQ